jgi:hypothetical protein
MEKQQQIEKQQLGAYGKRSPKKVGTEIGKPAAR